jgi:hypothetical protein
MTFPIINETEAPKYGAWDCSSADVHKHGLFTHIVDRRTNVTELLCIFSLSVCPGLLDALRAFEPSGLDFFTSLPVKNDHRRGGGGFLWVIRQFVMRGGFHLTT